MYVMHQVCTPNFYNTPGLLIIFDVDSPTTYTVLNGLYSS